MYLLHESASGYALFRVLDEAALAGLGPGGPPPRARDLLELVSFHQHAGVQEALEAQASALQRELSAGLRAFLEEGFLRLARADPRERLLLADPGLAAALRRACGVEASAPDAAVELDRLARHAAAELIRGFSPEHEARMALGLAHAFSRYRVKFGSGALDTMVIQAVSLVDDSEKELNMLSSRLREWENWHFSELEPLVPDQLAYARSAALIRSRAHMQAALDDPARREAFLASLDEASGGNAFAIVRAASTSVGTDITEEDAARLAALAEEIVRLSAYREELHAYIQNRMAAIAPNFTAVVGPVVGARLIAKAGSLMSLAKYPASTVQVLGAERALFRAKKAGSRRTPKYGYLYHAEYVSQASARNKGRMARVVATTASLAARVDALAEEPSPEFARERAARLGRALQYYEGGAAARAARRAQAGQKMREYRRAEGLSSASRPLDAGADVRPGAAAVGAGERGRPGASGASAVPAVSAVSAVPAVPAAPAAPAVSAVPAAPAGADADEERRARRERRKEEKARARERRAAETAEPAEAAGAAGAPETAAEAPAGAEEAPSAPAKPSKHSKSSKHEKGEKRGRAEGEAPAQEGEPDAAEKAEKRERREKREKHHKHGAKEDAGEDAKEAAREAAGLQKPEEPAGPVQPASSAPPAPPTPPAKPSKHARDPDEKHAHKKDKGEKKKHEPKQKK